MFPNFRLTEFEFLYPGSPSTRIYWPYLFTTLFLTFLIFVFRKKDEEKVTLRNFLKFSFPRSIYAHKSTLHDVLYFFFNQLVFLMFIFPFVLTTPLIARYIRLFLLSIFGAPTLQVIPSLPMNILMTFLAAFLSDFGQYLGHYLLHRSRILWNFHKVHHSAEVLTPMTLYRAHPIELFIFGNCTALATGLVFGFYNYFSTIPIALVTILQINFVVFFFNIVGSNLAHSHIWLPYPRFLSHLLLSPAQHQIHHSIEKIHHDKNLGSIFAIWDLIFKSLYIPKGEEKFQIGLPNGENKEYSGILNGYFVPFKKCLQLFWKRSPKIDLPSAGQSPL